MTHEFKHKQVRFTPTLILSLTADAALVGYQITAMPLQAEDTAYGETNEF